MPSRTTLERVKTIVRDSLKIGPEIEMSNTMPLIGGDHDFDSLDLLLVVTTIERDFKIKIPDRTVGRHVFGSIQSLAEFVESQKALSSS